MVQLKTMASCPVSGCLGEEPNPHPATTTFQVAIQSDKVTPEPLFSQAKQPQFPQSFLTGLVFQVSHQPCCPPLQMLNHLNILPKLKGPDLGTALKPLLPMLTLSISVHVYMNFSWAADFTPTLTYHPWACF